VPIYPSHYRSLCWTTDTGIDAAHTRIRSSAGASKRGGPYRLRHAAALEEQPELATGSQTRAQSMSESGERTLAQHDPMKIRMQLSGGGHLGGIVRDQMEQSFGTSFSSVRIHTDATAARLASELRARAFTIGRDIAFASGQYRPGTLAGDALIAHELAHTIQQRNGRPAGMGQASGDSNLRGRQTVRRLVPSRAGKDRHLLFGPPEMEFLSKGIHLPTRPRRVTADCGSWHRRCYRR